MKRLIFFACLLCSALSAAGRTPDEIVRDYLQAKAAILRRGSTAVEIERVLAFCTDDVVYEDPKVKVRIEGKDRMRSGQLSHIDDYAGSAAETSITVERTLSEANALAAVVEEHFWAKTESGRQEIRRKRFLIVEFRGEKISRVIDYH